MYVCKYEMMLGECVASYRIHIGPTIECDHIKHNGYFVYGKMEDPCLCVRRTMVLLGLPNVCVICTQNHRLYEVIIENEIIPGAYFAGFNIPAKHIYILFVAQPKNAVALSSSAFPLIVYIVAIYFVLCFASLTSMDFQYSCFFCPCRSLVLSMIGISWRCNFFYTELRSYK